jgi:type I restriction enzyme, S subunit
LRVRIACPQVNEQRVILEHLSTEIRGTEQAIAVAQRGIELLHEYRIRLIADVVTGKLDVREASGRLHDEAEEPELVDEGDAMSAVDKGSVDGLDSVPEEVEA